MGSHKELIVWQKAILLVEEIYKIIKLLPKEEMYALSEQMRRAAVSVPSNIAEGNARNSDKEYLHFLSIAQGSNAEIETHLIICQHLGYITDEQAAPALSLHAEIGKMLRKLINNVKDRSWKIETRG